MKSQPPPLTPAWRTRFGVDAKPVLITVVLIVIVASLSVWVLRRTITLASIPPSLESSESPADSVPAPPPSPTPSVSQADARRTTVNATRGRNTEGVARPEARANQAIADGSSSPPARGNTTGGDPEPHAANTRSADLLTSPELRAETRVDVAASDDPSIYSRSDPDVVPPVALARQPLGRLPSGTAISNLSRIEVLVNENGTVTRVKAQETPQSLDDAMILTMSLSAAKAWLFEPALKNGRPVKYRALITVSVR